MTVSQLFASKSVALTLVIVAVTLSITFFQALDVFSRFELATFDHRVSLFRAEQPAHSDVVVVLIDEGSLQSMNNALGRWPWPRAAYADLLEFFALAGAQVFAFDILFTERQQASDVGDDDQALVDATRAAGNVVHAMQLLNAAETNTARPLPEPFSHRYGLSSPDYAGPRYADYLLPFEPLYLVSSGVGYLEIVPDRDLVYRRIRLFNRYASGEVLPSLASAMILPFFENSGSVGYSMTTARIGELEIPLDGRGNFLINPYGRLQTYSIDQVFATMRQIRTGRSENLPLDPADFTGKLVLLGASAIGLHDVKSTALAATAPGVFLHAHAVSNLLLQDFLRAPSYPGFLAIIILFSCVGAAAILLPRILLAGFLLGTTATVLYLMTAYVAFSINLVLPIAAVLFAIVLSMSLAFLLRFYREARVNLAAAGAGSVCAVSDAPVPAADEAESRPAPTAAANTVSILVLRIHRLGDYSESMSTDRFVDLLSSLLSTADEVLNRYHGRRANFIGDSLLAFWAATPDSSTDTRQALECAIELHRVLDRPQEASEANIDPDLEIGIGLHTGDVILAETISETQPTYAIVGASVNTAFDMARLTRVYGSPVIVSETARGRLDPSISWLQLDRLLAENAQQPTGIYAPTELFARKNDLSISAAELQQRLQQAFGFYLSGEWRAAEKSYCEIGECVLSDLFADRCRQFQRQEPDGDWNGVYTA